MYHTNISRFETKELLKESLKEIRNDHTMTHCPICGNVVQSPFCKQYIRGFKGWLFVCSNCQIVWELKILNWTNERGDGAITSEGHNLYLQGYHNCFCRAEVFYDSFDNPLSILVHKNHSGHHSLGSACPNSTKKSKRQNS